MKRKLFTAFVILGALSLSACADTAMDEMEQLLEDTELQATDDDDKGNQGNDPTGGDTTSVAGRTTILID